MQTSTLDKALSMQAPRFTSRLSDRLSHTIAHGWLAEGLIALGVLGMLTAMFQ